MSLAHDWSELQCRVHNQWWPSRCILGRMARGIAHFERPAQQATEPGSNEARGKVYSLSSCLLVGLVVEFDGYAGVIKFWGPHENGDPGSPFFIMILGTLP